MGRVDLFLPGEGAFPKSHGETIAGLFGLLKDGAQRRRAAAARRAVLDQPEQPCTLQPSRDLRIAPDRVGRGFGCSTGPFGA